MKSSVLIEDSLHAALAATRSPASPRLLAEAMEYAVFPGGSRTRPWLCLAVARACGRPDSKAAIAAATSLELLHCASLVHDDLPCFDDADTRRGKPSVHAAYGESMAVLVGDALIIAAIESLVESLAATPEKLVPLMMVTTKAIGAPGGIIAGQAWESEPVIDLQEYHNSKTGALFVAACAAGAVAADVDPVPWRRVGAKIGEAYQALDDAMDVIGSAVELGKPINQDERNGRPSLMNSASIEQVDQKVSSLIDQALDAMPAKANPRELAQMLRKTANRFTVSAASMRAA